MQEIITILEQKLRASQSILHSLSGEDEQRYTERERGELAALVNALDAEGVKRLVKKVRNRYLDTADIKTLRLRAAMRSITGYERMTKLELISRLENGRTT